MPYKHSFKFLTLICFFFFFLHVGCNLQTEELAILLKLKQHWDDPPVMGHWNNASNTHYCSWPELTCVDGSVTGLNLTNGYFSLFANHNIPPYICDLKNITSLHLSDNFLGGDFPIALNNCSKLTHLDLSSNSFTGPIPSDIHRMANLQILNLERNKLTGNLPDSVFALKNLRELHLSKNRLSGEIPEIVSAFNLTVIDLSVNHFEGKISNSIAHLSGMETILLDRNNFSGTLPPAFGQHSPLSEFKVYSNRFTGGLPKNICGKGNLVTLDASNNSLSGELFESFSNCRGLVTLLVSSNKFSGRIPVDIYFLKQIVEFRAGNNRLSGPIPEMIASLPNLRILDLSINQLSGRIPDQLGVRNDLYCDLSSNPGLSTNLYDQNLPSNPGLSSSRFSYREIILIVSASVVATSLFLSIYVLLVKLRSKKREQNKPTDVPTWKFISFHVLSFQESNILSGMTEDNVVGQGGSGKVYRVRVDDTEGTFVAVKRICSKRKVDHNLEKQFLAEVDILGKIRHLNIVKLFCCISNESSKLLVYEYMENGSLDWWLHGNTSSGSSVSLIWPMRLKIAIGAAQGLCYMHHECSPPIIHRDVKSGNILLDAEFNAKVADFGLAKFFVTVGEANTASAIVGSFGYLAPEYAQTKRLNEKIDVYSFGVVLLELTTGKKANAGDEYTGLAQWAWRHMQEGNHIPDALDEDIRNSPDHHVEEMVEMFKLGVFCTAKLPSARPSMKEVLHILQSFQHQEHNRSPSRLEAFAIEFKHADGSFVNEATEHIMEEALDLVGARFRPNMIEVEKRALENEVYNEVVGIDKSGRARGYGSGVIVSELNELNYFGSSSSRNDVEEHYESIIRDYQVKVKECETLMNEMTALTTRNEEEARLAREEARVAREERVELLMRKL